MNILGPVSLSSSQSGNDVTKFQFTKCETNMRHFHCLADIKTLKDPKVVKTGVDNLYFSGSGQFSADNLQQLAMKVKEVRGNLEKDQPEIWIIDLRAEPHVFINGKPAFWKAKNNQINLEKTSSEIIEDENHRISQIGKSTLLWERKGTQISVDVQSVSNEQHLVEKQGYHYLRLPIVEHHKPSDECVEHLVHFILNHPNTWVHSHCYVKERTTIALTLVEMLYNAHQVSFDDILYRVNALGGSKLDKIPEKSAWNYSLLQERLAFLKNFYLYCKEANPLKNPHGTTWTHWLKQKKMQEN